MPARARADSVPTSPTVLTVFVASPEGLGEERDAVDQIATRLNATLGETLDVRIDVKRFEQLVGRGGPPQDQINRWVDECDVFIGIVHRRWGFPTELFDSGFTEEYERARHRWETTERPEICLFFKEVDSSSLADPGPQLQRVLDFRKHIEDTRQAFYNQFRTTEEFRTLSLQLLVEEMHKRGRVGATGEGYSPTHSAATRSEDVAESSESNGGELQAVLQNFVDAVSGRAPASPLDFDRLQLFALSASRDGALLPTHLVNRLFARRQHNDFRRIELDAWLRTYVSDLGRVKYLSERVVPYALVAGGAEQLARPLADNAPALLADDQADVRQGFLLAATALRVRPLAIWPRVPIGADRAARFAGTWSSAVRSATDLGFALEYWLAVQRRGDSARAALLMGSMPSVVHDLGVVLVGLLAENPDPGPLAEIAPELLDSQRVRRRFAGTNPYASLGQQALEAIIAKYGVPDGVRLGAFSELVRRDEVSKSVLLRVINEDNYESSLGRTWERSARKQIFDREASDGTLRSFTSLLPDLKKKDVVRDLTARLSRKNDPVREAAGELISWDGGDPEISDDRLGMVLTAAEGTGLYDDLARGVLRGDHPAMSAYLAGLERAGGKPYVLEYVRNRMEIAALRYLTHSPSAQLDRSWIQELRRLASSDGYVQHLALAILLPVAEREDVELLLAHLNSIFEHPRQIALRLILEKATLTRLTSLLESGDEGVAAASLAELHRRDRTPSRRRLVALLRSPDSRLRMVALELVWKTSSEMKLSSVLDEYLSGNGTAYYNVVCELDRRVAGIPATHPYLMP